MGNAMRTVAAAYAAVSAGRLDEVASLLSPELDWRALADEAGIVPRCRGRAQALEVMARGRLARGEVEVSELVEHGDLVVACVTSPDGEDRERFVVAEVSDGAIVRLRAFATRAEASAALERGTLREAGEE